MRIPSGVTDQYLCSSCKAEKPVEEFGVDKKNARGRRYACKECVNKKRRGQYQEKNRQYHLKRKYGITPDKFNCMVIQQGGLCAVCHETPLKRSGGRRARTSIGLHVDHCHVSGDVRGLLCHKCNVALGLFGDDPSRIDRAAKYVRGMPVEFLMGKEK